MLHITMTHIVSVINKILSKDNLLIKENRVRRLTPVECERLQGLSDGYTEGISDTQRYKCCGNAFNCDVIAHILSGVQTCIQKKGNQFCVAVQVH